MNSHPSLAKLATPALLLDRDRLDRNLERMRDRLSTSGVGFRPHLKTAKSVDVMRRVFAPGEIGPITVSTLAEAEHFAEAGARDILYAVGIAPNKLERVASLRAGGVDVSIILDNPDTAAFVSAASRAAGDAIPVLVEINSDGKRAGVRPDDAASLQAIAAALAEGASLKGVMTHAGASYAARTDEELRRFAALERDGVLRAADILRADGHDLSTVSVGSTPTALFAETYDGITEVRAGVYMFMDLVMNGVGVCDIDDIAISVLASVIALQPEDGRVVVDAGWNAMSRDRGTASQAIDQGYGLVCDADGRPLGDAILIETNQEHGVVASRSGKALDLRIGDMVRVLPNHACATAGQHGHYTVLDGPATPIAQWPRFNGW